MSTQSVKNIIQTNIDSAIVRAKQKIKDEGKKKITELKQQIPTPQQLVNKLKAEINVGSCSIEGFKKYEKKWNSINNKLKQLEDVTTKALTSLSKIEGKMNDIIGQAESGPIGKITMVTDTLNPIVQIFQQIITLSPLLFAANSGPSASGAVQDQITEKRNLAKSKVGEYVMLFATIPLMIKHFTNMARRTVSPLVILTNKIKFIQGEIIKLRLFIASLKMSYEEKCNEFNDSGIGNGSDCSCPEYTTQAACVAAECNWTGPIELTDLEKYQQLLADQYASVINQLANSGNTLALQRTFKLKDNLEEDYNIGFKTVTIP